MDHGVGDEPIIVQPVKLFRQSENGMESYLSHHVTWSVSLKGKMCAASNPAKLCPVLGIEATGSPVIQQHISRARTLVVKSSLCMPSFD